MELSPENVRRIIMAHDAAVLAAKESFLAGGVSLGEFAAAIEYARDACVDGIEAYLKTLPKEERDFACRAIAAEACRRGLEPQPPVLRS